MNDNKRPSLISPAKKVVVLIPTKISNVKTLIEVVDSKPDIGEIVAIGDGKLPVAMKVGDVVAYRKYGEAKLYVGSQLYLFVFFSDILGVLNNE